MPYFDVDDTALFYTDTDPGSNRPPVFLVHGWTCDSHDWAWQIAGLRDRYRLVALDLRGHGRSGVPRAGFTLDRYAGDLVALARHVGDAPGVFVGHSMGAIVSSVMVDRYPELALGLVVVDAPYGQEGESIGIARAFARSVTEPDGVQKTHDWLQAADGPQTPPWLATWHQRRILSMPHHVLSETVLDVHDNEASVANHPHTRDLWRRRRVPTLVVAAHEHLAQREVEFFSDPRSRSVAFTPAGHWLHQEQPDRFNALLDEWLTTVLVDNSVSV